MKVYQFLTHSLSSNKYWTVPCWFSLRCLWFVSFLKPNTLLNTMHYNYNKLTYNYVISVESRRPSGKRTIHWHHIGFYCGPIRSRKCVLSNQNSFKKVWKPFQSHGSVSHYYVNILSASFFQIYFVKIYLNKTFNTWNSLVTVQKTYLTGRSTSYQYQKRW